METHLGIARASGVGFIAREEAQIILPLDERAADPRDRALGQGMGFGIAQEPGGGEDQAEGGTGCEEPKGSAFACTS